MYNWNYKHHLVSDSFLLSWKSKGSRVYHRTMLVLIGTDNSSVYTFISGEIFSLMGIIIPRQIFL